MSPSVPHDPSRSRRRFGRRRSSPQAGDPDDFWNRDGITGGDFWAEPTPRVARPTDPSPSTDVPGSGGPSGPPRWSGRATGERLDRRSAARQSLGVEPPAQPGPPVPPPAPSPAPPLGGRPPAGLPPAPAQPAALPGREGYSAPDPGNYAGGRGAAALGGRPAGGPYRDHPRGDYGDAGTVSPAGGHDESGLLARRQAATAPGAVPPGGPSAAAGAPAVAATGAGSAGHHRSGDHDAIGESLDGGPRQLSDTGGHLAATSWRGGLLDGASADAPAGEQAGRRRTGAAGSDRRRADRGGTESGSVADPTRTRSDPWGGLDLSAGGATPVRPDRGDPWGQLGGPPSGATPAVGRRTGPHDRPPPGPPPAAGRRTGAYDRVPTGGVPVAGGGPPGGSPWGQLAGLPSGRTPTVGDRGPATPPPAAGPPARLLADRPAAAAAYPGAGTPSGATGPGGYATGPDTTGAYIYPGTSGTGGYPGAVPGQRGSGYPGPPGGHADPTGTGVYAAGTGRDPSGPIRAGGPGPAGPTGPAGGVPGPADDPGRQGGPPAGAVGPATERAPAVGTGAPTASRGSTAAGLAYGARRTDDDYDDDVYDEDDFDDDDFDGDEEPPRRGRWRRRLIALAVVMAVLAGALFAGWRYVDRRIDPPGGPGEAVAVEIPEGSSTGDIGKLLAGSGVISDSTVWGWYTRVKYVGSIQAGRYEMHRNSSFGEALAALKAGPEAPPALMVTVPEGYTVRQMIERVTSPENGVAGFEPDKVQAALDSGVARSRFVPADEASAEGTLFPETYRLEEGDDEAALVKQMIGQFDSVMDELEAERRAAELGVTPYEIVIIASLVEEEARVPE